MEEEEGVEETEDENNMNNDTLQNKIRRLNGNRTLKSRSNKDTIDNDSNANFGICSRYISEKGHGNYTINIEDSDGAYENV